MSFLRNVWYMAAWADEVGDGLFSRRVAGRPVLLYRTEEGSLVALEDRCPHRFAPLSRGRRDGDRVVCGYHGLTYDASGQCVHNSLAGGIPKGARVPSFPVVERDTIAWVWLGDPVAGLDMVGRLLGAKGRVLPMAAVPLEILAEVIGLDPLSPDEISSIRGQASVAKTQAEVRSVHLIPEDPPACQEAVESVDVADWIVLGPGSWFTSVIPHLLVPNLAAAIHRTAARRILTLNLEPAGETAGLSAARHVELLAEHAPALRLDVVLADEGFRRTCDR